MSMIRADQLTPSMIGTRVTVHAGGTLMTGTLTGFETVTDMLYSYATEQLPILRAVNITFTNGSITAHPTAEVTSNE